MNATPLDSPGPSGEASARSRPWWRVRLSLRAMMVLVLVIGAPLGWQARRASIQRRAVATVLSLSGKVSYEDEIDASGYPRRPHRPWGPRWLRGLIGDEFFQEVAWVNFDARRGGRQVDDGSIAVVNDFDHLQGITIRGPNHQTGQLPTRLVTAEGLARLTGLPRLRVLHFYQIGSDAAMLALVPRWPTLEDVTIRDQTKAIPGSSLAHLAKLPRLKVAVVTSVESSEEADLTPLAALKHLEQVIISRSPRSDRGVEQFASIPSLRLLNLLQTEMTPKTLSELARNPNLMSLSFDGSRLPTGGFSALANLSRLKYLDVSFDGHGGSPNAHHLIHRAAKRFGDADLDALRNAPLATLTIAGMDATDAGVRRLLQNLGFDSLTLGGRGITDASIPLLAQLTQLRTLVLADTGITDAGLAQLAAIPGLRTLSLVDNAALTDDGVAQLRTFPALEYLTIRQPGVQPATLDAFRAARSKVGPSFNLFQPPEEGSR